MKFRSMFLILALVSVVGVFLASNSFADDTSEAILKVLIKKGIISQREVDEMKAEITRGKPAVPRSLEDRLTKLEDRVPGWTEKIKFKGDLRLRYETMDWDADSIEDRHRGRIRFRLGADAKINDQWKLSAGLATGGNAVTSRNQSFDSTFSQQELDLDYAYMQYDAAPWVDLYGGKMKRKPILWEPTDLLWDSDITPEGGAATLSKKLDNLELFTNTGVFVLEESSSDESDPYMAYVQPGLKWKIDKNNSLKLAVALYRIDVAGHSLTNEGDAGNTDDAGGNYKYDYDAVNPAFQVDIKEPFWGIVPYSAIFAEYVEAFDPNDNNNGFAVGLKFGDKKVKDWGQWQFKYIYRKLEDDAWLNAFPDSDVYDGPLTHVKAHETILKYGLSKNVTLGIDYYTTSPLDETFTGTTNGSHHVLQADVIVKF